MGDFGFGLTKPESPWPAALEGWGRLAVVEDINLGLDAVVAVLAAPATSRLAPGFSDALTADLPSALVGAPVDALVARSAVAAILVVAGLADMALGGGPLDSASADAPDGAVDLSARLPRGDEADVGSLALVYSGAAGPGAKEERSSPDCLTGFVRTLDSGLGDAVPWGPAGFVFEVETSAAGDLPLSGGLVSALFSNMALRFLTWLMATSS